MGSDPVFGSVGHYRSLEPVTGSDPEDGLVTLTLSNKEGTDRLSTVNLAILAMARQRLGRRAGARGTLKSLKEAIEKLGVWATEEDDRLLGEVEGVLFDADFPSNPFAH
jgi:hypothetical protein